MRRRFFFPMISVVAAATTAPAQQPAASTPIAIVRLDAAHGSPTVTGALEVAGDRAMIAASGTITAGSHTAEVLLPRRGTLRLCASTSLRLAADTSVPADGGAAGLLLALDHGALELSLANRSAARNADVLMTPDFRILVSGSGAGTVAVRLGDKGDTCVDNAGAEAPYVLVSSLFEGGAYRVQPGQRVQFEHGSLHEVVDSEREPCGCPPEKTGDNAFPLAQSEGLEPLLSPKPSDGPVVTMPLERHGSGKSTAPEKKEEAAAPVSAPKAESQSFFARVGNFFRRIFGGE